MHTGRRPRGPNDPARRERIIATALTVIGERGVAGLTHRAVAAQARIPLGSTTYYFATLEDLLQAALEQVVARHEAVLHAWAESLGEAGPSRPADALADLIIESLGVNRERTVVDYELYLAAMSRPQLRSAASRYSAITIEVLSAFTAPATAVALSAALDGFLVRGLTAEQPIDPADIRAALAGILEPAAALPDTTVAEHRDGGQEA